MYFWSYWTFSFSDSYIKRAILNLLVQQSAELNSFGSSFSGLLQIYSFFLELFATIFRPKTKKRLQKRDGDIKLPMFLCCKSGGKLWNKPFENHKMGPFQGFKMVPLHKIETFHWARDFFGPLNGTSDNEGHFGAKKVSGTGTLLVIMPCRGHNAPNKTG